jgi:hypothetical protein
VGEAERRPARQRREAEAVIVFLAGVCAFLGVAVGWLALEHHRWHRRPPSRPPLPVWDGLPASDLRALPDLDPWDPNLGASERRRRYLERGGWNG